MTASNQHSELVEMILAGIQDGYNEGDDEFDCSPDARCTSCVGCEAVEAVSKLHALADQREELNHELSEMQDRYKRLEEQLEALEQRMETIRGLVSNARVSDWPHGFDAYGFLDDVEQASYPAKRLGDE